MIDQPKLKPQRADIFGGRPTGTFDRLPAPSRSTRRRIHSRRRRRRSRRALQNPLPHTPDVIAHGKFVWDNVCITCHGPKGAGDGTLTQLFPKPPSLMTQKVRDWPDGEIFHRPMRGQGSMPSHARQVDARDIWSVVHYIRQMQSEQPVAPPAAAAQPAATGAAAEPAAGKTTGGCHDTFACRGAAPGA